MDSKTQQMGKLIGDLAVTMYIWIGLLLLIAAVITAMIIRYKKRKNIDDKGKAQSRIVIYLLIGLLLLILLPLVTGFFI